MVAVKSIKIDGESIHVFNSAIYLFESSIGITLQLDVVVSEVAAKKYQHVENVIMEIELDSGQMINSIMHVNILPGRIPQINFFCELGDALEYQDIDRFSENDSSFPKIDEGITIEEIRKVEMPNEAIRLKLKLPIDQVEWLAKQKNNTLNDLFKELIYEYWKK